MSIAKYVFARTVYHLLLHILFEFLYRNFMSIAKYVFARTVYHLLLHILFEKSEYVSQHTKLIISCVISCSRGNNVKSVKHDRISMPVLVHLLIKL